MGILTTKIRWLAPGGLSPFRRGFLRVAALMLFFLSSTGLCESSVGGYRLKAAFIHNFSKFVEWPENAFRGKKEFCIVTLGRYRDLVALSGMNVQGHSIVFRKLTSPEDAALCQVLFISRSELTRLEGILDAIRDLPVLTIAESNDFCKMGGDALPGKGEREDRLRCELPRDPAFPAETELATL